MAKKQKGSALVIVLFLLLCSTIWFSLLLNNSFNSRVKSHFDSQQIENEFIAQCQWLLNYEEFKKNSIELDTLNILANENNHSNFTSILDSQNIWFACDANTSIGHFNRKWGWALNGLETPFVINRNSEPEDLSYNQSPNFEFKSPNPNLDKVFNLGKQFLQSQISELDTTQEFKPINIRSVNQLLDLPENSFIEGFIDINTSESVQITNKKISVKGTISIVGPLTFSNCEFISSENIMLKGIQLKQSNFKSSNKIELIESGSRDALFLSPYLLIQSSKLKGFNQFFKKDISPSELQNIALNEGLYLENSTFEGIFLGYANPNHLGEVYSILNIDKNSQFNGLAINGASTFNKGIFKGILFSQSLSCKSQDAKYCIGNGDWFSLNKNALVLPPVFKDIFNDGNWQLIDQQFTPGKMN